MRLFKSMKPIPLTKLLAERAAIVAETERLPKVKETADRELEELMQTTAIDDEKAINILSALRTRSELVPIKLRQCEETIDRIDLALRTEIEQTIRQLNVIARQEAEELHASVCSALKVFIPAIEQDDLLVRQAANRSGTYQERIAYLDLSIGHFNYTGAAEAGAALVALAGKHKIDLAVLPPAPAWPPVPAPEPEPEPAANTGAETAQD